MLDGVYRISEGMPVFHPVRAPTAEQLQALLIRMIKRLMRLLTRKGYLVEEQGMTYLADHDPESALAPLQAAACTYRIALGPRAGQKVLTLQTLPSQTARPSQQRCVNEQGLACMLTCDSPSISATSWNIYAATSPGPLLPTSDSNAITTAKSCCNSKAPTTTAPPIS